MDALDKFKKWLMSNGYTDRKDEKTVHGMYPTKRKMIQYMKEYLMKFEIIFILSEVPTDIESAYAFLLNKIKNK